jgi:hypothetical protein
VAGQARARVLVVARVSAPKALVLVEDSAGGGELPLTIPGQLVAATASSIAVGCAASAATELTVGDLGAAEAKASAPVFDGKLATPSRRLAVRTILGATLLEVVVPTTDTRVRIWANTPAEPTALTIGVARAAAGIAR